MKLSTVITVLYSTKGWKIAKPWVYYTKTKFKYTRIHSKENSNDILIQQLLIKWALYTTLGYDII